MKDMVVGMNARRRQPISCSRDSVVRKIHMAFHAASIVSIAPLSVRRVETVKKMIIEIVSF